MMDDLFARWQKFLDMMALAERRVGERGTLEAYNETETARRLPEAAIPEYAYRDQPDLALANRYTEAASMSDTLAGEGAGWLKRLLSVAPIAVGAAGYEGGKALGLTNQMKPLTGVGEDETTSPASILNVLAAIAGGLRAGGNMGGYQPPPPRPSEPPLGQGVPPEIAAWLAGRGRQLRGGY